MCFRPKDVHAQVHKNKSSSNPSAEVYFENIRKKMGETKPIVKDRIGPLDQQGYDSDDDSGKVTMIIRDDLRKKERNRIVLMSPSLSPSTPKSEKGESSEGRDDDDTLFTNELLLLGAADLEQPRKKKLSEPTSKAKKQKQKQRHKQRQKHSDPASNQDQAHPQPQSPPQPQPQPQPQKPKQQKQKRSDPTVRQQQQQQQQHQEEKEPELKQVEQQQKQQRQHQQHEQPQPQQQLSKQEVEQVLQEIDADHGVVPKVSSSPSSPVPAISKLSEEQIYHRLQASRDELLRQVKQLEHDAELIRQQNNVEKAKFLMEQGYLAVRLDMLQEDNSYLLDKTHKLNKKILTIQTTIY